MIHLFMIENEEILVIKAHNKREAMGLMAVEYPEDSRSFRYLGSVDTDTDNVGKVLLPKK